MSRRAQYFETSFAIGRTAERIRIISARRATKYRERVTIAQNAR